MQQRLVMFQEHLNINFNLTFVGERKSEDVKPNPMYLYQRDITDEYIEQKFGSYTTVTFDWKLSHCFL